MLGLQEIIYSLEVGSLRQWLVRLGILALLGGLGVFYFIKQFNGFKHPEAMDMAQVGRQIARGEGYTTKFIRPLQLSLMSNQAGDLSRVPDVVNAPAFPYLSALIFKVSGVNFVVDKQRLRDFSHFGPERLIVLLNLALTILSVIVLYLWTLRAFDSRVATLAALLFALTDAVWSSAISGLAFPLGMLLVSLIGFLINEALVAEEGDSFGLASFWFIIGVFLVGVLTLTHYAFIALWPCIILLGVLAFHQKITMTSVAFFLPLLIISPWLYRNFDLTGNPFGFSWVNIFVDNGRYPGSLLWRIYDFGAGSPAGLKPLLRAVGLGVSNVFENGSAFLGGVVPLALMLACCFHSFKRHRNKGAHWFWLGVIFLVAVFNGALIKEGDPTDLVGSNLMLPLLPVFCGFGAAFAFILFDRLKLPSQLLIYPLVALLCIIQAAPMGLRVLQKTTPPFAYPPYFPPVVFLLKDWIKPNEVMCSDIPWATAWYADRLSLWLPSKREEFYTLNDFEIKIVAILLTPKSQNSKLFTEIESGQYGDWAGVIARRDFTNLPLPSLTVLPPNKDDYLLIADRPRWKE